MDKESGNFGLYLTNMSAEKVFVRANFYVLNKSGNIKNFQTMKRVFEANNDSWGFAEFIKKDVLDNKMDDLLDKSGRLNIILKMSGKRKKDARTYNDMMFLIILGNFSVAKRINNHKQSL